MKVTSDSDGGITVSIPREDAKELVSALEDAQYDVGYFQAEMFRTLADGIRAALDKKGLDI